MKEIAKTFLAVPHTAPWIYDESASALVNFVYEGGIWDARAREKYPAIRQKSPQGVAGGEAMKLILLARFLRDTFGKMLLRQADRPLPSSIPSQSQRCHSDVRTRFHNQTP